MARTAAFHATGTRTVTAVPRLTLWRSHAPSDPTPAIFEPKFYMLLAGRKRIVLGDGVMDFMPGDYAVSCLSLPFKGQIVEASPKTPYVGIELALAPEIVAGVLLDAPGIGVGEGPALAKAHATPDLAAPLDRLLRLLPDPRDIAVLAPQLERELYYRLLQGPAGATLRRAVERGTRFAQIQTAARWICDNADRPMQVAALAAAAGMSVTTFHRHFKAVTTRSPLAYQRHIRLLDAQRLLASGLVAATTAAFASGYASASQFSREYKRMFGMSPGRTRRDRGETRA